LILLPSECSLVGKLLKARARQAVIVCAGINSSKILELSGIGSSSILKAANIRPVLSNPSVGIGLQGYPSFSIALLANPSDVGVPSGAPYSYTIANVYLPYVGQPNDTKRMMQIRFDYFPNGTAQNPVAQLVLHIVLLTPVSQGSVHIQSNNPFQIAAADIGIYTNDNDLTSMKDGIQVYLQAVLDQLALLASPPFYRPLISDPFNIVVLSGYSDIAVMSYLKNNTDLGFALPFYSGHCAMGSNGTGVVDGKLQPPKVGCNQLDLPRPMGRKFR
jgi:choline dehydrogenase-like flavoprotein